MLSRPLHAVLASSRRLFEALAAALDGSGPAILPLDPGLPRARLDELIAAFAPAAMETTEGMKWLAPAGQPGQARAGSGVSEDVAVVLATSGSTGLPKGAELTATALRASARASLRRLGAPAGARWLCCLPTHHIAGLGVLVRSLESGSEPVLADRIDAGLPAGCDYVSLVPTQLQRLLKAAAPPASAPLARAPLASAPLAKFKGILLGGAAISPVLLAEAAAAGARVVTTYGMTETCGGCVYDGLPLDGVRIASDADGLIRISGPVLFSRYRGAPELTAASLRDGWFVTSDLGGLAADGRLTLLGRADDVINTGGEKVVPVVVEEALAGLGSVREVAVVGLPDAIWGERVTAIIVPADHKAPPGLAELREQVQDKLPGYAAPKAVIYVTEIPMLASGKPDRLKLRSIAAPEK